MAIYYSLGNALVTREELYEKSAALEQFRTRVEGKKGGSVRFTNGKMTERDVIRPRLKMSAMTKTNFVAVGMNKPLTIELRHIYTGHHPKSGFLGRKKDVLVTSALKGFISYDAAPKAINLLKEKIGPQSHLKFSASEQGTPLVFYSPAITQPTTLLSIEVIFDTFPKEVFTKISNAFTSAGSIPVFASASFYMIAAGMVTKLLGAAGESIFDGNLAFRMDDDLSFERPGTVVPIADFRLITKSDFDSTILSTHEIGANGVLVDKNGTAYEGEHPYVTISLDGRENKAYKSFVPTAISASLLERFYNVKAGNEQSLDTLYEALSLYNDIKYRAEADKLQAELKKLTQDSEEYKELKKKHEALVANIMEDLLKPS